MGTGLSYADPKIHDPYVHNMEGEACLTQMLPRTSTTPFTPCTTKAPGASGTSTSLETRTCFIFGESYAGKYVPAIASKILTESGKAGAFLTGLRGVGIGDGFHPPIQTSWLRWERFSYNLGLIDFHERSKVEQLIINGTFQIKHLPIL